MLKLIPQEIPEKSASQQENLKLQKKKVKIAYVTKLQQKINEELRSDEKIIQVSLIKLMDYLKKTGNYSAKEMEELIHSMQRSVLSLQRKRSKLLRNAEAKHESKKRKNS